MTDLHFGIITGLTLEENRQLATLAEVFNYHQPYNETKDKYYEGHITLNDVNIGIALPGGIKKLEVGCNWGQKTVDVLAARSMFDGFVGKNTEALTQMVANNRLIAEYSKACRDELKYGCVFASLSADDAIGCRVSRRRAQAAGDGAVLRQPQVQQPLQQCPLEPELRHRAVLAGPQRVQRHAVL